MTSEYTAIRNYVTAAVATAWAVTVIKAQDARERDTQFAVVSLAGDVSLERHAPTNDQVTFLFQIVGRFTLNSGVDAELQALTRGAELRTQLLASKNPGTVGFAPMVPSVSTEAVEPQDNRYDVVVTFSCSTIVTR